jgi:phage protein D
VPNESWVPQYKVKLNGKELSQEDDAHLQQIVVDLRRQAPGSCELQFNNHAQESSTYDTRDDLGPGTKIEVAVGYTGAAPQKIFEGEIVGTQVKVAENQPRVFVARAFDGLHKLTRGRKTRTFLQQKFSEIISQVAQEKGLQVQADDTAFMREYVVQHNQTDLDFARGIAGWLDFDLCINHLTNSTTVRFKAPDVSATPEVKAVYENPNGDEIPLRRFDGRQSLGRVVSEVIVRGWDPAQKKEIIGKAAASQVYGNMGGQTSAPAEVTESWGETERQLVDYKVFSQQEADKIARTKLNEYARTFIRADIEVQGNAKLRAGGIISIKNVGTRYDGNYLIDQVTHIFTSKVQTGGGYTSRISAERCGW